MDLVRYRFLDSVTNYLQCGDVKLRLVPLACLNGGRFQMYALPPVAVSGVLDRLRAPVTVVTVTGRRVSSQPWCLRLKGSGPTASTGAASRGLSRYWVLGTNCTLFAVGYTSSGQSWMPLGCSLSWSLRGFGAGWKLFLAASLLSTFALKWEP